MGRNTSFPVLLKESLLIAELKIFYRTQIAVHLGSLRISVYSFPILNDKLYENCHVFQQNSNI